MLEKITDVQFATLEALATYRYLTAEQLQRLNISKSIEHTRRVLRELVLLRGYLGRLVPGVSVGRLPNLHYLTKKGAHVLAELKGVDLAAVPYVTRARMVQHTFFHRLNCIDCEITVRQWAQSNAATVEFYNQYFCFNGNKKGRRSLTKITLQQGGFDPDAVFMLSCNGVRRLFALEVQKNLRTAETVQKLLENYKPAVLQRAISAQFNYDYDPRILIVFDQDNAFDLVKQRLLELQFFRDYAPLFFFNTLDSFNLSFLENWRKLDTDETCNLF
jgi:hypothetical protein